MKQEIFKCDGCGSQCEHFFHFNDVIIHRANGKKGNIVYGYQELELKGKTFCSFQCIEYYLENKADVSLGENFDYFIPGEQIGVPTPKGVCPR